MLKILLVLSGIALVGLLGSNSYSDSNMMNIPIDEIEINPGEKLVILDTTGTGIINPLSISASLPCNSGSGSSTGTYNDYPDLKIQVGTLDNLIDFISSPEDDPGHSGLTDLCIFQDTMTTPADNVPVLTTIVLTNDGSVPVLIPDGSSISIDSMIHPMDATKTINVTKVRNHYNNTYEIPGEPGQSNTVDVEYVIGIPSIVKIDIIDDANGSIVNSTGDMEKNPGTYAWNATWTWKNTPDSYAVRSYFKSGSSYILNDEIRGFVQADKITQGSSSDYSPNMYTRGVRSVINEDYDKFEFRYWYWDNTHNQNPDQGTTRLNNLVNLIQEGSFPGKLETEFRRNIDGFDAGIPSGTACIPLSWNSNLPNPQAEVEESVCTWPNDNEEVEIFTHDEESIQVNSGSDPSYEYIEGYFSEFTVFKKNKGTSVELAMEFEAEKCNNPFDSNCTTFEITEATKQTEVV